ncbi:MAG: urea transporter [Patescibacteria group bacterium]
MHFIKILLRGVSQVMLQNNAFTGALFLFGIFYNSWIMGLGAILGAVTSTLAAYFFKNNKEDIQNGLYGFNGTLVGIALFYFFEINLLLVIISIIGAVLSSAVMYYMHTRKLSPFTFPFVLSAWIIMLMIQLLNLVPWATNAVSSAVKINILPSLSMGFGQVMFQASIITGLIFFLAILVNSRRAAFYGLAGSLLGMLAAMVFSFPVNLINIGIFGFNGVLCGIAFSEKNKLSWALALVSIVISVLIMSGFNSLSLIALTAPFVFASWITLGLRKVILNRFSVVNSRQQFKK